MTGRKVSEEEAKKTTIIFEGEKFDFPDVSGIGTSQKGTIKIDPSKNLKWMDSKATNDNTKGQVSLGIYEFTEDHYRVCFAPPGKPRPTEFSSKPGSNHRFTVWKRINANESAEKDLVKMQGTWALVSGERDGKKVSEEEAKNTVITIGGSDFVFPDVSKIGTSAKGTIKLDPTKNPKWIDPTSSKDGVKSLGIYEFVGSGYRACFAEPGKDRPQDFSAKSGSGHNLQVWADSVEGTYVLVSGELKGQALAKEVVQAASLVIEGNKHKAIAGSDPIIGTHKLSPGKTPKEIDSQETEGPSKGLTLGIYKYENGEFTVCFAAPGKDRPKEFTTKSGTGEFIHAWKKK